MVEVVEIYNLMNKGEGKLTKLESTKLSKMAMAAELYEENILGLKPFKEPETISELVELKLFENKKTQKISIKRELVNSINNNNISMFQRLKGDIYYLQKNYISAIQAYTLSLREFQTAKLLIKRAKCHRKLKEYDEGY